MRLLMIMTLMAGCGGGSNAGQDLYLSCDIPEDCDAPEEVEAVCLDKSGEGFCTWSCTVEDECVEAADEAFDFVCASFESEEGKHCFPSCQDAEQACPPGFGCRSTGGGSDHRKVCFPEDP